MIIEVLVIEPDGSQHFETMEVADNWYESTDEAEAE